MLPLVPKVSSQTENVKIVSYSYTLIHQVLGCGGRSPKRRHNPSYNIAVQGEVTSSDEPLQAPTHISLATNLIPQQKAPFYLKSSHQTTQTT